MADDADKINEPYRAPEQLRTEPPPPGYFEGESLTRRKVFTIAAQAIGGLAGAAIILPAVGFAVAPIFHRGKDDGDTEPPKDTCKAPCRTVSPPAEPARNATVISAASGPAR